MDQWPCLTDERKAARPDAWRLLLTVLEYEGPQLGIFSREDGPLFLGLAADAEGQDKRGPLVRWVFASLDTKYPGNLCEFFGTRQLQVADLDVSMRSLQQWSLPPGAINEDHLPRPDCELPLPNALMLADYMEKVA